MRRQRWAVGGVVAAWLAAAGCGGAQTGAPNAGAGEVQLPGIDTSNLTGRERREFSRYVSELPSPCADVAVPVAQCVLENRPCSRCIPAAKFLLAQVRDGRSREQIDAAYKARFDPSTARSIPLDGSPTRGPTDAPVVIVEFADFECPFCAQMAPTLDKAIDERKDKVLFVFKLLPLSMHVHAEPAARAAIAAGNQGKFWEMHDLLFANRERLETSDLEGYAQRLGLDLARFRADMQSPETTARLTRDRNLADTLGVRGTPTIYINGREYDVHQSLGEWIDEELSSADGRGGAPDAAPPVPSGRP